MSTRKHLLTLLPLTVLAGCGDSTVPMFDLSGPDLSVPVGTTLAPAETLTNCLAVDADGVYWADQGGGMNRVLKVALAGGAPVPLAGGVDPRGCVVADGGFVYFTSGDALMSVATSGAGGAQAVVAGQNFLGRLFATGGYVYWITDVYGQVDAYNGKNAIVRVQSGGGVEILFAGVVGNPGGLAVDDNNLYYSDQLGVFAQPRAGGTAVQFANGGAFHENVFAVDAAHLAMVEIAGVGQGDVALLRLDGMGRQVISPSLAAALQLDETGLYASQGGQLVRIALDATRTDVLANDAPRAIALDATSVYFTDGSGIQKVPKPQ